MKTWRLPMFAALSALVAVSKTSSDPVNAAIKGPTLILRAKDATPQQGAIQKQVSPFMLPPALSEGSPCTVSQN